jgi:DNA invertase Pin-like site-specific DNA recombinase
MAVHHRNTASSHAQEPPLTIARVALYARVSTLNGQDPEMQLSELREYVSRRGWTITSEYVDQGVSGSKESRPQLNQLMADAHRRKFDAVLVWKIDRFGRSLKHLVNALADLCAYGVAFVSFRDNLDLSTPSGRLMFQIIGAMAEFERSLIQERVRAGLRNARAKGKKFGRPRVQVDAVRVAELRRDGLSWSQVCRTLNVSKGSAQRSVARLPKGDVLVGQYFVRLPPRSSWLRGGEQHECPLKSRSYRKIDHDLRANGQVALGRQILQDASIGRTSL